MGGFFQRNSHDPVIVTFITYSQYLTIDTDCCYHCKNKKILKILNFYTNNKGEKNNYVNIK